MSAKKSFFKKLVELASRQPLGTVGACLVLVLIAAALLAPLISPYDPTYINLEHKLQPPSSNHIFGTDDMGRDIFSRVLYGARISIKVGMIVLFVAVSLGVSIGLIAGFFGGILDYALMRITDIFLSFPQLVLAMAIAASLGRDLSYAMLAVGLVWWPWYARLVRGIVLSIRKKEFIEAATAVGAHPIRILFRHILPNAVPAIIVQASLDVGYAILATAGLSFIGLGAQPPTPEWGAMVYQGRTYMTTHWWYPTFPGIAILFTVFAVNLMGDALRDLLDPKTRGA